MLAGGVPLLLVFALIMSIMKKRQLHWLADYGVQTTAEAQITEVRNIPHRTKNGRDYNTWDVTETVTYRVSGRPVTAAYIRRNGKETDQVGGARRFSLFYDPNEPEYTSVSAPRASRGVFRVIGAVIGAGAFLGLPVLLIGSEPVFGGVFVGILALIVAGILISARKTAKQNPEAPKEMPAEMLPSAAETEGSEQSPRKTRVLAVAMLILIAIPVLFLFGALGFYFVWNIKRSTSLQQGVVIEKDFVPKGTAVRTTFTERTGRNKRREKTGVSYTKKDQYLLTLEGETGGVWEVRKYEVPVAVYEGADYGEEVAVTKDFSYHWTAFELEDIFGNRKLTPEEAASEYKQRGDRYLENRAFSRAIEQYAKAIALTPEDRTLYLSRGGAYFEEREYGAAVADFTAALDISPDAAVLAGRGGAYLQTGDLDRALADYAAAVALAPNVGSAELWRRVIEYTKEIQRDPNDYWYNERGVAFYNAGYFALAAEDFTRSIERNPNDPVVYNNRGNAYYSKHVSGRGNDLDRAIADYTEAIRLDPNAVVYGNRAGVYRVLNAPDKAIADYTEALRLDPSLDWVQERLQELRNAP